MKKSRIALMVLALTALIGCDGLLVNIVPSADNSQSEDIVDAFYVLTLDTFGEGEVLVDQAGTSFKCNTKLRLSAAAKDGWMFDHWEGDAEGDDPVITVTMNRDKHITAVFVEIAPDLIELEVLPVGKGIVVMTPQGEEREHGFLFPIGTKVTLDAEPAPGWVFLGYYSEEGTLLSEDEVTDFVLETSTCIVAKFAVVVPPPPLPILGEEVFAGNGQFLGLILDDPFDPESMANPYGEYGDIFSPFCVWNEFGLYGTDYGNLSAYDPYAADPPGVYLDGCFQGYLTKNPDFQPQFDPDDVADAIGRYDVIRD